jgi:hypothetical protein
MDRQNMQLCLYQGEEQQEVDELASSQDLVMEIRKREYIDYNSKEGEIIDIDDIEDERILPYMLSEQESRLKEIIWKSQNADYLKKQKLIKKRNKKMNDKKHAKGGRQQQIITHASQVSQVSVSGGLDSVSNDSDEKDLNSHRDGFQSPAPKTIEDTSTYSHNLCRKEKGGEKKKPRVD